MIFERDTKTSCASLIEPWIDETQRTWPEILDPLYKAGNPNAKRGTQHAASRQPCSPASASHGIPMIGSSLNRLPFIRRSPLSDGLQGEQANGRHL
jgi:hypothetical protein